MGLGQVPLQSYVQGLSSQLEDNKEAVDFFGEGAGEGSPARSYVVGEEQPVRSVLWGRGMPSVDGRCAAAARPGGLWDASANGAPL